MARVMPHPQHSTPKRFLKIQIVLPLQIFSNGIAYSTAGSSSSISSLVNFDRVSLCIGEVACQYHYEINQGPYSTTATGEQLRYSSTGFTCIKTVYTKTTQEETEQCHHKPFTVHAILFLIRAIHSTTTFHTNDSIVVYLCSAMFTKHKNSIFNYTNLFYLTFILAFIK